MKIDNVNPSEYDDTCYIVGGGPSLRFFNWELLKDKFVIAVNRAYEVLPNAQIVYFTDDEWYHDHKNNLLQHSGIKVKGSLDPNRLKDQPMKIHQYHLISEKGLTLKHGCLSHGKNSAYAAINLAGVHLGFKKIYLMGIDLKWGRPGDQTSSHWHDGHKRIDPEMIYAIMLQNYQSIVEPLKANDIEVINVNAPGQTNLTVFPIKSFREVFYTT